MAIALHIPEMVSGINLHFNITPMKVIIFAPENSLYKRYNGFTFTVSKVLHHGLFCVDIDGALTDFSSAELLIVDLEQEVQTAVNNLKYRHFSLQDHHRIIKSLSIYASTHKIDAYADLNDSL